MQKRDIEKLVEETLSSFDGAERASAKPFLLTRIFARMQNKDAAPNLWSRAGAFLSKPAVAFCGLLLILAVNAAIIISNVQSNNNNTAVQNTNMAKDDFAINVISIYDLENQEP